MCAYNSAPFIESAVQSVLEQSYDNLELIIVDDCSTDNTYAIVAKKAEQDKRIRVFRNETNLGPSASRNRCIALSKGEFIQFHDSDDIMLKDKILSCIGELEKHEGYSGVLTCAYVADEDCRPSLHIKDMPLYMRSSPYMIRGFERCYSPTWTIFYRKSDFPGVTFDESMRVAEDYDFFLSLLCHAKKFSYISTPLMYYRNSPGSLSKKKPGDLRYIYSKHPLHMVRRLYRNAGYDEKTFAFAAGLISLQAKNFSEAEYYLSAAIHKAGDTVEWTAPFLLASAFYFQDRYEEALAALEQCLERKGALPEILNNIGVCKKAAGHNNADSNFVAALEVMPGYLDAYRNTIREADHPFYYTCLPLRADVDAGKNT